MIKHSILILFFGTILILGLTGPSQGPFDQRRDPVPSTQKVAHSSHCAGCHGFDEVGEALVDAQGKDINIYDDWQFSMMGLSAHDPFWRATISHEVNQYPAAKAEIETTCLKCHSPLGSIQSHLSGKPYSYATMLQDSLGLDGVSCSSCHQQPARNLGKGQSGNFTIDTNRIMFGPYPNPFQGPMQIYVGFNPVFSDHIYSSGVCAGCHTLITKTLKDDGTPSGDFFVEQATYHEWVNSSYPAQGKECQNCHLPFIQDSVVVATDFKALKKRYPFGLHQFFGANTAMLSLMKNNRDSLHLLLTSPNRLWDESIKNNRLSISRAATLSISPLQVFDDTLYFEITLKNKTGHKFPSGYPSRLAWLQVVLTDPTGTDTLYANGILDKDGNIIGRDLPYEPHHQESKSSDDVQIYEMVMSDLQGHLTTRLNAAFKPLKDNRLLPLGFNRNHEVYDTVAVWGEALTDPDYGIASTSGADIIAYKLPLNGNQGLANLHVSFLYHSLPSRWMNDLFTDDTLSQVAQFKSMYEGYQLFTELISKLDIADIDLSTTSTRDISNSSQIMLYPNPGTDNEVFIKFPDSFGNIQSIHYDLIDLNGMIIQSGSTNNKVWLNTDLKPGLYYFIFYTDQRYLGIKPYSKF
ncbi:MAG: T9SS type A sorting domain-containing protein [Saprospiraceae bacterium]